MKKKNYYQVKDDFNKKEMLKNYQTFGCFATSFDEGVASLTVTETAPSLVRAVYLGTIGSIT